MQLIMINRDVPGTASAGHFHGEYPGMVCNSNLYEHRCIL